MHPQLCPRGGLRPRRQVGSRVSTAQPPWVGRPRQDALDSRGDPKTFSYPCNNDMTLRQQSSVTGTRRHPGDPRPRWRKERAPSVSGQVKTQVHNPSSTIDTKVGRSRVGYSLVGLPVGLGDWGEGRPGARGGCSVQLEVLLGPGDPSGFSSSGLWVGPTRIEVPCPQRVGDGNDLLATLSDRSSGPTGLRVSVGRSTSSRTRTKGRPRPGPPPPQSRRLPERFPKSRIYR